MLEHRKVNEAVQPDQKHPLTRSNETTEETYIEEPTQIIERTTAISPYFLERVTGILFGAANRKDSSKGYSSARSDSDYRSLADEDLAGTHLLDALSRIVSEIQKFHGEVDVKSPVFLEKLTRIVLDAISFNSSPGICDFKQCDADDDSGELADEDTTNILDNMFTGSQGLGIERSLSEMTIKGTDSTARGVAGENPIGKDWVSPEATINICEHEYIEAVQSEFRVTRWQGWVDHELQKAGMGGGLSCGLGDQATPNQDEVKPISDAFVSASSSAIGQCSYYNSGSILARKQI